VSPLATLAIALVTAGLCARGVGDLAQRLSESLARLRTVGPAEGVGATYRSQRVAEPDRRAPLYLAIAAQAQAWLVVVGSVRLGVLPLDIINLVDEPHRRLGLTPADDSLVAWHALLGAVIVLSCVTAWLSRRSIVKLADGLEPPRDLHRLRALATGALASGLAAAAGAATTAAMVLGTPMSIYWLRAMGAQSAIYAAGAGLVTTVSIVALRAARRRQVVTL
jgi:hypothetical protein